MEIINKILVNDCGVIISGIKKLADPSFGVEFNDGTQPIVDWSLIKNSYTDENGFDKNNIENNGKYLITDYILPKGLIIIRYGSIIGRFTAPKGTNYNELSLPYIRDTVEYHEFKVIANNLKVKCIVEKGRVSKGFNMPGGGIQFHHKTSILQQIASKLLLPVKNN